MMALLSHANRDGLSRKRKGEGYAQQRVRMAEMGAAHSCAGYGNEQPVQRSKRMERLFGRA